MSKKAIPNATKERALINPAQYQQMYDESIQDPEAFWHKQGRRIDWITPYTQTKTTSFAQDNVSIEWYRDGGLNVAANCLDRHLEQRGDQVAIIWEGDNSQEKRAITYTELHHLVCQCGNALQRMGVVKGDVVTIYMPMIPEAAIAMLACARIGAVHSVIFGGFSPEAIAGRVANSASTLIITADSGPRAGKQTPLKANVDTAIAKLGFAVQTLVVKRSGEPVAWDDTRDHWWHDMLDSADCPPVEMNAEDPLFILYTSGSTGAPKGLTHTSGGYLVYASITFEYIFDYHPGDIFWCSADVGWITGHSYIVYGPLANGATTVMFEGVPTYPDTSRWGQIIEQYGVTVFYTAPTAIRALMADGDNVLGNSDLSSLKLLGTVGEPINPEAWEWYSRVFGNGKLAIVDTWWQTETGAALISPLPGAIEAKPGSATKPFFGIQPALVDADGVILEGAAAGNLVLLDSWPGQARSIWGDHPRFVATYFSTHAGKYFTSDGARRDEDGYYWITGRIDDVMNISGHRLGTAEVESALVAHPLVVEAAVVGFHHDIKGQAIYAYVTLKHGVADTDALNAELKQWVRQEIGAIATPETIQWAPGLPKTRSGKIMRRILRQIAKNEYEQLGDISTLADTSVVSSLIAEHKYISG